MLAAIFLIISGLILIGSAGAKVPLIGKFLVRAGTWLGMFAIIVGIADIIIGIIHLF